jgi:hypothetical protein
MPIKTRPTRPVVHVSRPAYRAGRPRATSQAFFGKKPGGVRAAPLALQKQIMAGHRADKHERQADAVAEVVTRDAAASRAPGTAKVTRVISPLPGMLPQARREMSRAEAPREEEAVQAKDAGAKADADQEVQARAEPDQEVRAETEEKVQAQADTGEEVQAKARDEDPVRVKAEAHEEPVQARAGAPRGDVARNGEDAAAVRQELRAREGRGTPLDAGVRSRLEPRFGASFAAIRIHLDAGAVRLTRLLHAQAFTRGRDIYFNAGRFDTGSAEGRRLLAHELTHTVQQGAVPAAAPPEPHRGHTGCKEDEEAGAAPRLTHWTPGGQA